jgi:hypothetical protein
MRVEPEQGEPPAEVRTVASPVPAVRIRLEELAAGETRVFYLDPP